MNITGRVKSGAKPTETRFKTQKKPPLSDLISFPMVPKAGLEPAHLSMVDFESTASTDFATSALKGCGKRWGLYRYPLFPQPLSAG